jgi:sugar phosphate isomerase/epimerase
MLPELDFDQQIDLCRRLGLTHYVFRPRQIPDHARDAPYTCWGNHKFDLTPQRLIDEGPALADRLEAAGLTPFGSVPDSANADDDDRFTHHLRGAAAARLRNMRIGLPALPDGVFDWRRCLAHARDRLSRMIELARPYGVKLVIEMHAGSLAVDPAAAHALCDGFDPTEVGLIFDLPNLARQGIRHAGLSVSAAAPYLDHAHVGGYTHLTASLDDRPRDDAGFATPAGTMSRLVDNDLHVPLWLSLVHQAVPQAPLILEDYTPGKPAVDRLTDTVAAVRRALAATCVAPRHDERRPG